MNRHSIIPLRLLALIGALACAAALVLLVELRPPPPALPRSLASPLTLTLVRGLLGLGLWLLLFALAGLLLVRSLRALLARRPQPPPRALRTDAVVNPRQSRLRPRWVAAGSAAMFAPPFPLIVRARPELAGELQQEVAQVARAVAVAPAGAPAADDAREVTSSRGQWTVSSPSIVLLGPLEIFGTKARRRGLRSVTQEFLAYLALRPHGATTDELIALWPQINGEKAKERLWQAVTDARARLGDLLMRDGDRYLLDRDAVRIDVDEFESLVAEAGQKQARERARLLECALRLVRGDPLAGSDYPWAEGDVRHLRAAIVGVLERLGYLRLDDGDATGALNAAERGIALDSLNEKLWRLALQAEGVLGLREAVIERYERLCQALDERLGLEPERETRSLYLEILSQT